MAFQVEASFLVWELFWRGSSFGSRVVHVTSVQRKGMAQVFYLCQQGTGLWFKRLLIPFLLAKEGYSSKGSREMGHFQSTCPKASIKVILEYHSFGTCVFGH